MSLLIEPHIGTVLDYPDGFAELDTTYKQYPTTEEERRIFGQYALSNCQIMETPKEVIDAGEVLTNPSQIESAAVSIEGKIKEVHFAYFRREPVSMHLGKTRSVPYTITKGEDGVARLSQFSEAMELVGEDPRLMRGIKMRMPSGKVATGWCVSTVVATPKPGNPADVESIEQVFYWGETLASMEPVNIIKGKKNTCILPLSYISGDEDDTRVEVWGRPHPDITVAQAQDITTVTSDLVESGRNITMGKLPIGVHVGVNTPKFVPGYPDLRELDIHEAYAPITPQGKELHYRLGRYGFDIGTMRLIFLGMVANRKDFPFAEPKPPENGVGNYYDVVYGSMGHAHVGKMVTGLSDRHVGYADLVRLP